MSNGTVRRPAVPSQVRIRRDVSKLPSSDRTLEFYEKAIAEMQTRGLDKPTSWRYQGAIHDYPSDSSGNVDTTPFPNRPGDPNQKSTDKFPVDANRFWRKCEHDSWFFLPWHRMYLHFFEKIIAKIVADVFGGPKDWALPYWNVTDNPLLPKPFQKPPDGSPPSHLYVSRRFARANEGQSFLDIIQLADGSVVPDPAKPDTNLNCLKAKAFKGKDPAFGGLVRTFHFPGQDGGALEMAPHNQVHSAFQPGSFMINPQTAALDPIFWLHHCNIDRLWEVWIQRQKSRSDKSKKDEPRFDRNPKDTKPDPKEKPDPKKPMKTIEDTEGASWLSEVSFSFHDENGIEATMTSKDVIDTRQPPLSYEYEDISDPFKGAD